MPDRVVHARVTRNLAWFRVAGWGLWVKWGRDPDVYTVRLHAHRIGRVRWKVLRP